MTEVERIAKGLTKAQILCLTYLEGSLGICRALKRKGLADRIEGTGMAWQAYPKLTTLGLAVRNHLMKEVK